MDPDGRGGQGAKPVEAPPPFLSWRLLYGLVIVALALEVAAFAVLSAVYR